MYASLCRGWNTSILRTGASLAPASLSPDYANGATSDPATMSNAKPEHHRAPTRGGANPSTVYPLTTGCGDRILYLEHPTLAGGSRASSLSLADALCRRPRRRLGDRMTLPFAKLHPASPGGREVFDRLGAHCSEARLLLLLGGDLALGGRFLLRRGLRLRCFLHHTALLVRA
jgi:hypothetical protein